MAATENKLMIFSGSSNPELAKKIAEHLNLEMGKAKIGHFSDGEMDIEILENVRGQEVFIVQSTCAPAAENLVELLLIADALRRASAAKITAVMPYFGFARQDRRVRSARVPISAKVVADMLDAVGIENVLTIDLHADQIQGFFSKPVDNLYSSPVIIDDIRSKNLKNIMVISPDVGGVVRARAFTKLLPGADLAIIDKRRPKPNRAQVMHVIGDVADCDCIIVDDMVDTAGTLLTATAALKEHGAKTVRAYATHAVLSGNAIENIENSVVDEVVVTDTIPLTEKAKKCQKIRVLSVGVMLAKVIKRIRYAESLSTLFT